jgi:hypothetical protein
MKIKKLAYALAIAGLSVSAANAAHVWEDPSGWWDSHFYMARDGANRFNAQEITLDLFGSYMAGQRGIDEIFDTNIRRGHWGGGVGLNYFFTRELGVGVDMNIPANGGNFVDSVSGSLIARLPWEQAGLAPYIFGGGGRITEPRYQWGIHAGLGLEYRFNPMTGIFIDGRYVWADDAYEDHIGRDPKADGDHLLFRAGLRWAF